MGTNKINLLMAIHCHQPVGNFGWVFKEAYDKAYLPFVKTLEKHPKIKVALHYSGSLMDWIKEFRPEFLDILRKLVKANQVEIMAGGYYEPIFPLIPDRDKLGQLKMHIDYVKKNTGCQPNGMWLPERVWEPHLAKVFSQAGLEYTIVDDAHFEKIGKKTDEILGYFMTEEEGHSVALFPSSKQLRYNLPFKLPKKTIDYLKSVATPNGERAVTFGDDGEKFGLWPETYKWVYEEGWLDKFFKALGENSDWINTITPSEYLKNHEPLDRLYLPSGTYPEMLEWSGGYFKNFLIKYPEANWLHKRMLNVSEKVGAVNKERTEALKGAKESLYKAQCHCAYWHGVFGGLYLHHLRASVFNNLISAENIVDSLSDKKSPIKAQIQDIDKDGADEIILENGPFGLYVDPSEGGSIVELDYKPKLLNIVNTLTRRPEAYHEDLTKGKKVIRVKENNLSRVLVYDKYKKCFLTEHFLSSNTTIGNFAKGTFKELGDFVSGPYQHKLKQGTDNISLLLEREGSVLAEPSSKKPLSIKISKTLELESNKPSLKVAYKLRNKSASQAKLWFGVEFNMSLRDPYYAEGGELLNIDQLRIEDEWFHSIIEYNLTKNANVWFYPVETVSGSEGGFERTYQQICVLFHWPITIASKAAWPLEISFALR